MCYLLWHSVLRWESSLEGWDLCSAFTLGLGANVPGFPRVAVWGKQGWVLFVPCELWQWLHRKMLSLMRMRKGKTEIAAKGWGGDSPCTATGLGLVLLPEGLTKCLFLSWLLFVKKPLSASTWFRQVMQPGLSRGRGAHPAARMRDKDRNGKVGHVPARSPSTQGIVAVQGCASMRVLENSFEENSPQSTPDKTTPR